MKWQRFMDLHMTREIELLCQLVALYFHLIRVSFYADKKFISNTFSSSNYKSFSEDIVGVSKIYLSSINGLDDDDVRLSKRQFYHLQS